MRASAEWGLERGECSSLSAFKNVRETCAHQSKDPHIVAGCLNNIYRRLNDLHDWDMGVARGCPWIVSSFVLLDLAAWQLDDSNLSEHAVDFDQLCTSL